jgi:hypothetical protein
VPQKPTRGTKSINVELQAELVDNLREQARLNKRTLKAELEIALNRRIKIYDEIRKGYLEIAEFIKDNLDSGNIEKVVLMQATTQASSSIIDVISGQSGPAREKAGFKTEVYIQLPKTVKRVSGDNAAKGSAHYLINRILHWGTGGIIWNGYDSLATRPFVWIKTKNAKDERLLIGHYVYWSYNTYMKWPGQQVNDMFALRTMSPEEFKMWGHNQPGFLFVGGSEKWPELHKMIEDDLFLLNNGGLVKMENNKLLEHLEEWVAKG